MSKILFALVAAAAICCHADASGSGKESKENGVSRLMRKTGGFIPAPRGSSKSVKIVNVDAAAPVGSIEDVLIGIEQGPRFIGEKAEGRKGEKFQPDDKAGLVIVVEDNPECDTVLLTAPEKGWASVNVALLKKDSPAEHKFRARVTKEIWRAICYTLGAGNNDFPVCVLKPVTTLKELDALKSLQPSPNPFLTMIPAAAKFGVNAARMTTYRRACLEGWAPAPTNDIQKAVWDDVHAMPTRPIEIKYDPKRDK